MGIFKNKELQALFERDGFVKISLVNQNIIQQLTDLYKEVQPVSYPGFSSTIYNPNIELKKETSKKIYHQVHESVTENFENFRSLGCSFLCKTSGADSFLPVHQDWTIVDESKFDSITIWIPLIDTNEHNGAFRALRGSHRFSTVLRSPTLPGVFQNISEELYNHMELINVNAGEALVFSQALIHTSPPNMSGKDRIVATYGLIPSEANLYFYHREKNDKVIKYKIQDDFFLTYNNIGSAPDLASCEVMEEFDYKWRDWNSTDLKIALARTLQQNKFSDMKRLFKDDAVQEFYHKNGFVKFRILDEADVKTLFDYYYEEGLTDQYGTGFSMSMEVHDKEKVARIRDKIYEVALPKAMSHFDNAKVIAGSYVVKHKNPTGIVPPHQDWTFADDEGEYCSVTCWISLVDTCLENGYMSVVKGSHTMLNNLRPSPSPQIPTPLMNHMFPLFPYMEMYEMKAGEALIFDHRTFHGSTPNITDNPRIAVGLGFTQKDATICHYTLKNNGKKDTLLKYYVDDAFLLKYDNSLLSRMYDKNEVIQGYEIAEEFPFDFKEPTWEELVAMAEQQGNVYNTEMAVYLANLFGYNTTKEETIETKEDKPVEVKPVVDLPNEVPHREPFLKVYTPLNILREIKLRLVGK